MHAYYDLHKLLLNRHDHDATTPQLGQVCSCWRSFANI